MVDIPRWVPQNWEQFIGIQRAVRRFKGVVKNLRRLIATGSAEHSSLPMNCPNLLLTGPSRSGKTAMVKLLIRCLICKEFDAVTLSPCQKSCRACMYEPELVGNEGLFAEGLAYGANGRTQIPVQLHIVDCTKIKSREDLDSKIGKLGAENQGLRIYYFDEVHRLITRAMDEMLLKAVDDIPGLWILSTAKPAGLEDMLLNRFVKISTELPTEKELAEWLADRCNEWRIAWKVNALVRVVERSNRVPGIALHALGLASLNEDRLTLDLVENDWEIDVDTAPTEAAK
jgi:Holliday junction resolvasome RuvABC ATP-dependent DNA helicase subunit